MNKTADIKIFNTEHDLFEDLAIDFIQRAKRVTQNKAMFTVVLSGGNTPKAYFDVLVSRTSKEQVPWDKIQFFFGDERYLPSGNVDTNYYLASKHLFSKLPIPKNNIFGIPTEYSDPAQAALEYQLTLQKVLGLNQNEYPQFDLVYLGLGENGHTASLMPHSAPVNQYLAQKSAAKTIQLVASLWVPDLNMYRITLTPSAINHSDNILFIVTGSNKSSIVSQVLEGPQAPSGYPAQLIHAASGKTLWYLDRPAASKIKTPRMS